MLPLIVGCRGPRLTQDERICFEELSPAGFILFARNIQDRAQLQELCASLHASSPAARTLILIDQEGGRVQRLTPPHWRGFPPAQTFGNMWRQHGKNKAIQACRASARLMGEELAEAGITVACAPVADLPRADADPIIGDRAFASSIERVQALARAQSQGLSDAGILPVAKHVPGHGRATCDSHKALPRVTTRRGDLAKNDFACFLALKDLPMMMTAHIRYDDIDSAQPATLSKKVIERVVRGDIGFKGLLITDDICMSALSGNIEKRARGSLEAGCDLALYCGHSLKTIRAIAKSLADTSSLPSFLPAKLVRALLGKARHEKTRRERFAPSPSLPAKIARALEKAASGRKPLSRQQRQRAEKLVAQAEEQRQ